jgi:hypothetical protein
MGYLRWRYQYVEWRARTQGKLAPSPSCAALENARNQPRAVRVRSGHEASSGLPVAHSTIAATSTQA